MMPCTKTRIFDRCEDRTKRLFTQDLSAGQNCDGAFVGSPMAGVPQDKSNDIKANCTIGPPWKWPK